MTIISRYLAKEVYSHLLATAVILLAIFISNQVVRYLQSAAAGEIAGNVVALLLLLQLPHLLALLLPLSLFLAILIAYGRLYADNEMTVLFSCGYSPLQLFSTTLKFSLAVVAFVAALTLWVEPRVARYTEQILAGTTSSALELLIPNKFQTINNGQWVVYADKASRDKKKLGGFFATEQLDNSSMTSQHPSAGIVTAKGGYKMVDRGSGDAYLVLTDGYRYEGAPGKKSFKMMKYSEYGIKLQQKNTDWQATESTTKTGGLWQNRHDKIAMTEVAWRVSLPVTAFVLALLGVGLSRIKPKHGRYAKLLPAAICYIVYAQLIFLSRVWMKKGILPLFLNMWWVHLLMLGLVIFLMARQNKLKI